MNLSPTRSDNNLGSYRLTAIPFVVEYESDPDLRDSEQIPLLEPGGIEAFFRREVLPISGKKEPASAS